MSRDPQWQTTVKASVSGDRTRAPLQAHPRWKWTLRSGVLQTAFGDLQAIQNLYTAMYGRWDYFLWKDPDGESIADPTSQVNYLGTYYWPVAFTEDSMDFDRFAYQLWECGACEFEQVMAPQGGGGGGGGSVFPPQFPNGLATSAVVSFLTTHIQGTGYTGIASISLGSGYTTFDSAAWTGRTDTSSWNNGSNQWTAPVGPLVATTDPTSIMVTFSITGSVLGDASVADKLYIYDVSMDVTYENAAVVTFHPTVATVTAGAGTVTNAANAVDGNPVTYAEIDRTHFSGAVDSPFLHVSGFTS